MSNPNQYYFQGSGGGGYGRGQAPPQMNMHPGNPQMNMHPQMQMGHPGQMMGSAGGYGRGGGYQYPGGQQQQQGYEYGMPMDNMGRGGGGGGGPRGPVPAAPGRPVDNRGPVPAPQIPTATPSNEAVRYANDCEIVVTAKPQQQYAEMIEKAIKDMNLKVDLMFPKPEVKLASFIDNISSFGTIFAIVIRPDNEAHRSVSVHVLRGPPKPEEHRNMPLSAAYQLIRDRYYDLKRKEVGVIPENIKGVLKMLMEEKTPSDVEYSSVIKFLQSRRRKQNAFEKRTSNIIGLAVGDEDLLNNPEADALRTKILTILGEIKPDTPEGERIGDLVVPRPKEPLGTLIGEPSVQNAINNLQTEFPGMNASKGSSNLPIGRGGGGGFGRGQPMGRGSGYS